MTRKRHREYDEREVSILLGRAAELQGGAALVPVTGTRTLEEIRAIAVEAGMDRAALEVAVQELDHAEVPRVPLIGRSARMEFVTSIDGMLDESDRRELLGILQRSLDAKGTVKESGHGLEWRHFGLLGRELVVVSAHKGRTRIEVRGRYRRALVATFGGGGLLGGAAAMGLLDLLRVLNTLDAAALPLVLGAAFLAGRTLWSWVSKAKERMLRRTADRLGDFAEENVQAEHPQQKALPPREEP